MGTWQKWLGFWFDCYYYFLYLGPSINSDFLCVCFFFHKACPRLKTNKIRLSHPNGILCLYYGNYYMRVGYAGLIQDCPDPYQYLLFLWAKPQGSSSLHDIAQAPRAPVEMQHGQKEKYWASFLTSSCVHQGVSAAADRPLQLLLPLCPQHRR